MGKGGEDKTVNIGPIGLPEGQNDALPGVFSGESILDGKVYSLNLYDIMGREGRNLWFLRYEKRFRII